MIFTEYDGDNIYMHDPLYESYIYEVSIGNRIREVIKQYNWKRKVKKRDFKALTEKVTLYIRKEVHSKSDLDKFYRNNDYCIECVSGDDELCQIIANTLAVNFDISPPVEMYIVSGKDMNKAYDLYGDNAYQDDVRHVIIPLKTVKSKDVIQAKIKLKARYFNDIVDNNEYREYEAGRHKKSEQIQWIIDYYNESYIGGENMDNNVLAFSGNNGGSYIYDGLYESYIQAKIDSEDRLAFALKEAMVISEADYSNIRALQEAKLGDKIKSKWQKFIAFIKRMAAKFLESMSNILLDEKEYLEKYKDIILKKTPKSDMEFSYTGNYEVGIKRLINTEIPLFNYATYKKELEDEGESALANKIVSDFHYVDGDSLSEQFKSYFLDLDAGQQQGKFSSLRMVDLYNFCYNFNKIKNIVDHDINNLESSTRLIESEAKKQMTATNSDAAVDKTDQTASTTTQTDNTGEEGENGGSANTSDKTYDTGSAIMKTNLGAISEAEEEKAKSTGLKVTTSAPSKMTSTTDTTKKDIQTAAKNSADTGGDADAITKAADKWISVCRALISAKLTACQQIAKDYMEIIRAHVRSYGGTDKNDKTGNTSPGTPTEYSKDREKAAANDKTEQETKEADKKYQDAMNKTT